MVTQAVVLAGGLGTRLKDLTRETPKPLLPVGGRPFIAWLLDELRRQGVRRIILSAGFRAEKLIDALGDASDVNIIVEPEPLGTGGALRFVSDRLDDVFFFLNGDSLFDIDLAQLRDGRPSSGSILALRPMPDASRYGTVTLSGDRVTAFNHRGLAGPGLINGGVAVLTKDVARSIDPDRPVSIEAEVYKTLATSGALYGRVFDRPFIDIGVPEDLAQSQTVVPELLSGRV